MNKLVIALVTLFILIVCTCCALITHKYTVVYNNFKDTLSIEAYAFSANKNGAVEFDTESQVIFVYNVNKIIKQ